MFSEEDLKDFMVWHPEESRVDETKIKEWLNVMLEEPDLRNYVLQKLNVLHRNHNYDVFAQSSIIKLCNQVLRKFINIIADSRTSARSED